MADSRDKCDRGKSSSDEDEEGSFEELHSGLDFESKGSPKNSRLTNQYPNSVGSMFPNNDFPQSCDSDKIEYHRSISESALDYHNSGSGLLSASNSYSHSCNLGKIDHHLSISQAKRAQESTSGLLVGHTQQIESNCSTKNQNSTSNSDFTPLDISASDDEEEESLNKLIEDYNFEVSFGRLLDSVLTPDKES